MYQRTFLVHPDVTSSAVLRYIEKYVLDDSNDKLEISTTDSASRRLHTKPVKNKDAVNKPKQNAKDGKGKANKQRHSYSIPTYQSVDTPIMLASFPKKWNDIDCKVFQLWRPEGISPHGDGQCQWNTREKRPIHGAKHQGFGPHSRVAGIVMWEQTLDMRVDGSQRNVTRLCHR
jgi:hypothetical protein